MYMFIQAEVTFGNAKKGSTYVIYTVKCLKYRSLTETIKMYSLLLRRITLYCYKEFRL